MSLSLFIDVPKAVCAKEIQLHKTFKRDPNAKKVFLGQRVFMSDDGRPWLPLPVRRVCLQVLRDPTINYQLAQGQSSSFLQGAKELAVGKQCFALTENRVGGIQTLGSTGALRIGAEFLHHWYKTDVLNRAVCVIFSTCDLYQQIFGNAGFTDIRFYNFWDSTTRSLALTDMLEDLEKSPDFSIFVLPIAFSPTGIQIKNKEWQQIAILMKKKKIFPFFHMIAQGLATGDADKDAWPLRYFIGEGFELFCAQSFSTNFGLYGERVGCLLTVLRTNEVLIQVRTQLQKLAFTKYLLSPVFGSRIVAAVLNNTSYYNEWKDSLKLAAERLMAIREKIKERLKITGSFESWEHITHQLGVFSYTGLTPARVEFLAKEKHIYLHANGLMNISCLTPKNLEYVIQSIVQATHLIPDDDNSSI
ncbi:aspartate aminotransferase, cytoplasmic-like [Pelodytes ibericus]